MSEALATREPVVALMRDVAQQLAALPPERYGEAMEFLSFLEKATEGLKTTFGERVKDAALANGTLKTEKGTKEWLTNGYSIRAVPTRTGIDPKKLEARLRAKGLDPAVAMDQTIAYKVSEPKLAVAIAGGKLTREEADGCKYELNYKLSVEREDNREG